MSASPDSRRTGLHDPLATAEAIADEPAPFPRTTAQQPLETGFPDWRERLTANLARRSDGRWDPLTEIRAAPAPPDE